MRQNPVYRREVRASSRSIRLPLILMLFNAILSLAALLNMYSVVTQVRTSAVIQYTSFMEMYRFVSSIEFLMLLFIVPALTAASVSGERERQTLDLMLTTQMTAAEVVCGKLAGALGTMALLILSSMPAVGMVLVFGGITWMDALELVICYAAAAFFAGSVGIFFSSAFKRSTVSTVAAYGVLAVVVAGTYLLCRFAYSLSAMNISQTTAAYLTGENAPQPTAGVSFYLLLLNPAVSFYGLISGQMQGGASMAVLCGQLGMDSSSLMMRWWLPVSLGLQLALGAFLTLAAVRFVDPVRRPLFGAGRNRKEKSGVS